MKSRFPIVALGKHVQQVSLRNRADANIEVFSVTNSEGFTRSTDYFSKEVFSKDVSNYKVVRPSQFAYNPSRINVGSIDYLRHNGPVLVSPLYVVFEGGKGVHADYLLRYLKSDWGNAQIRANTEGAVRDSLKFKGLGNIKIPLPPLDDQKRIAHLLGKVEELIAQRKQHLQQLDDLLKSVFLEMFGSQAPGYATWPLVEIKDLAAKHKGAMRTGPFGSNLLHSEFATEGDVAVLGIDNAVQNRFEWAERRFITSEKYRELESYRIYPGDVIVTIMGTIGRSAVIPRDIPLAINTKHLAAITLNTKIANPLFVSYSIHSSPFILNQFKSRNRGAIMSGLNLGIIKETKVKRPPIDLQNRFAAIHIRIEELKSRYQQSLADLENLYGALSQKAFKGELDLSRVVVTTEQSEVRGKVVPFRQGFARQLIAAEILSRHNNNQMTQMKLQKLIHLTEYHAQLDEIQGDYQRQAAGPYDNKLMYGLAAGLEKQHWFKIRGSGQKATYSSLTKAGGHKKYLSHWADRIEKIDEVLNLLGKATPEQCEIVSTLYAAWNDLLIEGARISDERIITEASHPDRWHQAKAAIDPEKWPKALDWMREHHLVPSGYGKQTRKLREGMSSDATKAGQAASAKNQPAPATIPQRILAAIRPGREYSRSELTAASGISDSEWTWAIRQLKDEGKVVQTGERRGARYCINS